MPSSDYMCSTCNKTLNSPLKLSCGSLTCACTVSYTGWTLPDLPDAHPMMLTMMWNHLTSLLLANCMFEHPFGLLEIKCPFSFHDKTSEEAAASDGSFCSQIKLYSDGKTSLQLKQSHPYFCQVQGQMAIAERMWCDFVVYTEKKISIEQVEFDKNFWNNDLLPKLKTFYDNCLAPEIVSLVHVLGMPVRKINKKCEILIIFLNVLLLCIVYIII